MGPLMKMALCLKKGLVRSIAFNIHQLLFNQFLYLPLSFRRTFARLPNLTYLLEVRSKFFGFHSLSPVNVKSILNISHLICNISQHPTAIADVLNPTLQLQFLIYLVSV